MAPRLPASNTNSLMSAHVLTRWRNYKDRSLNSSAAAVDYESSASPQTQRFLARKLTYDSSIAAQARCEAGEEREVVEGKGEEKLWESCDRRSAHFEIAPERGRASGFVRFLPARTVLTRWAGRRTFWDTIRKGTEASP
jgi:hypothetical protein